MSEVISVQDVDLTSLELGTEGFRLNRDVQQAEIQIHNGTKVEVDAKIAPAVRLLTDLGFITIASCQGMVDNHKPNVLPYVVLKWGARRLEPQGPAFWISPTGIGNILSKHVRAFWINEQMSWENGKRVRFIDGQVLVMVKFLPDSLPGDQDG